MSNSRSRKYTVRQVMGVFESIAPRSLAQEWDNVGLLAGCPDDACGRVLCCIDMTGPVASEAIEKKADLILAYHPPLFRAIKSLRADSGGTEALVWRVVSKGIAIYSMHTALDAAEGGTNDVLAGLCGLTNLEPFSFVAEEGSETKLVTFVPPEQVDKVAGALAEAGAGQIGDYSQCSFRLSGRGTFFGDESTDPAVGQKGRLEHVDEIRLEMVVPAERVADAVAGLIAAHPYEEPAYDIYPLQPKPTRWGIGRCGKFGRKISLGALARKLKKAVGASGIEVVGEPETQLERGAVCVGAAGTLPLELPRSANCDCIVTGEIRHHDALTILRRGKTAIGLGHWTSERPVLGPLAEQIRARLPGLAIEVSQADAEPFSRM